MTHDAVRFGPSAWLTRNARHCPDLVCLRDEGLGRSITFSELDRRVNQLCHALAAAGLGPADRVLVVSTDSHQFAETWLACLRAGLTCVPLNIRLAPAEILTLLDSAKPRLVLLDDRQAERLTGLLADRHRDLPVIRYGEEYESLLAGRPEWEPAVAVDPEAIVGLSFTSGTTGRPKAVLQSARMLTNLVISRLINFPPERAEVWYSASSMFHIAGIAGLASGISAGYTSVILPRFEASTVIRWLAEDQINVCFVVPTMINDLLTELGDRRPEFAALRAIIYGAAPMTPALLRRAVDTFGCQFIQLFGAGTEAGMQCSLSWADHQRALAGDEHLLGSIGRPAFGVELRLTDPELREVPVGEIGEITVRSGMLMTGYADLPEQTAEALRDGWFRAGDLARMDDEGYLYLAGRRSDMVIRGGENVYPIEIEAVLANHPSVAQVAVTGAPDARWGEIVVAFVVASEAVSEDELRAFARQSLAKYKVPERVHFVASLPRNASGKIVKRELVPPA
jgi:acyl-CoA synthetase (AMP-forming)/AMP-acid ligase II